MVIWQAAEFQIPKQQQVRSHAMQTNHDTPKESQQQYHTLDYIWHMNYWTELSIDYASQRSYLDDLFQVYPTIPEGIREINGDSWAKIEAAFKKKNNETLLKELLKLNLFPIKDSYIAYLKRDKTSIDRNPKTINRICGRLYEMGLPKIMERCTEPKETNRQIGPLFRRWTNSKALGIQPVSLNDLLKIKKMLSSMAAINS